jgi:hypothetical protein
MILATPPVIQITITQRLMDIIIVLSVPPTVLLALMDLLVPLVPDHMFCIPMPVLTQLVLMIIMIMQEFVTLAILIAILVTVH